jgi:hypothetical protein
LSGVGLFGSGAWLSSSGIMPPAIVNENRTASHLHDQASARTFDALRVVLDAHDVAVVISEDHLAQTLRLDVFPPLLRVLGLHNDHVATLAAFVQQSTSRRSFLEGRNEFDQVTAERY